jgi:hypothetical protein
MQDLLYATGAELFHTLVDFDDSMVLIKISRAHGPARKAGNVECIAVDACRLRQARFAPAAAS